MLDQFYKREVGTLGVSVTCLEPTVLKGKEPGLNQTLILELTVLPGTRWLRSAYNCLKNILNKKWFQVLVIDHGHGVHKYWLLTFQEKYARKSLPLT